jgi:hypothetical protein
MKGHEGKQGTDGEPVRIHSTFCYTITRKHQHIFVFSFFFFQGQRGEKGESGPRGPDGPRVRITLLFIDDRKIIFWTIDGPGF